MGCFKLLNSGKIQQIQAILSRVAGENHANQRPGEISEGRASRAKRNEPEVTAAWNVCGTAVEAEMAGEARVQCM